MNLLFVTGATRAYFPTLLVLLQSFAEQIGGNPPCVCDYGLDTGQRHFLRRRGLLLERPPAFRHAIHPLREKALLSAYLGHNGIDASGLDAVIWLDADLTIVGCTRTDFESATDEMTARGIIIAASPQGTIADLLAVLRRLNPITEPFERALADSAIEHTRTYYSSGIFICRSPSFLDEWRELGFRVADHPVLDQNMFNVVIHRSAAPVLALDSEEWQAQGDALDRVQLAPAAAQGRQIAYLGERQVKILHATSPSMRHLFVGPASLAVHDLVLDGAFKLLRSKPLLELQLGLLGRFLVSHGTELVELGICTRTDIAAHGIAFSSLPVGPIAHARA